jgi:hypothetical protein
MTPRRHVLGKRQKAEPSTIWHDWLVGVELAFLRLSPLYWGYGIPTGMARLSFWFRDFLAQTSI